MVMLFQDDVSDSRTGSTKEICALKAELWDWQTALSKEMNVNSDYLAVFEQNPLNASHDEAFSTAVFNNARRIVTCANLNQGYRVYFGGLPPAVPVDEYQPWDDACVYLHINGLNYRPFISPINPITGTTVVFSEGQWDLWDVNVNRVRTQPFDPDNELLECGDWLDPHTLAFGCNTYKELGRRCVGLWDTRTVGGISGRFIVKNRMTDIKNARMLPPKTPRFSPPLLTIPHVHEGPRAHLAVNSQGIVATVDRDDAVQLYSLRKGVHLRSLPHAAGATHLPPRLSGGGTRRLRWYEDPDTSVETLMACRGHEILRWRV